MIDNIDGLLDLNAIDDYNQFDFNTNTGTYTWSQGTQSWSKSLSPSNKIIIEFPSASWVSNNDAIFTLHSYSDVSLLYDGDNYYAPSSVNADLYVSGTKVFDITGNFSYDQLSATPIPVSINSVITFNPLTIEVVGLRTTPTKFQADISITDNNNCQTNIHADLELTHSDYENLENTDLVEVNTIVEHGNMKITGYMDGDLISYDDPSNNQINAMSNVEVFYSNTKIGDLFMQANSNGDDKIYINYNDGTSDDVEIFYDPFITNVEQLLIPFLGDW